ncbi:hypothetical protein AnigIFM63326_008593 [Aspergillus niger]|nr:hypothetical protein AnigIFM63326_008593 [Aspergillus niger]
MSAPRRNGQLSSCEPCRKSKLRCDHSAPTCNRCVRRGKADLCVYHPAPLTKPRELSRPLKATRTATKEQMLVPAKTLKWDSLSASSPATVLTPAAFPNPSKLPFSGSGFLGPTSYSGAFSNSELDVVDFPSSTRSTPIDPQQVARGAQVLFLLEHLPLFAEISKKRFTISPGWVFGSPLMDQLFKVLEEVYRNATQDSGNKKARKKSDELRRSLPPYLQWTEDKTDPQVASFHIEFLYHEFLLLQTLYKRVGKGIDDFVNKALEIISILLHMVSLETRSGQVHPTVILDLCYIGLPAAGTLCTELLRRSQPQASVATASPQTPFPRSDIIQKLSVFVAQLKTFARQQEGDYEICIKGERIISQALDRVLSPAPVGVVASSDDPWNNEPPGGDIGDTDFMAFLENFDWEQEMRLTFGC